jgi:hypothetical protein
MTDQPRSPDPKAAHAPQDMTEPPAPPEGQEERPEAGLPKQKPPEDNVWLRDGADSPDAADIADPETQL